MDRPVPPYYSNREDNMSCSLANYRSIIEFFTGKRPSWEEVENLQGFKPGVAAWTIKALTEMSEDGWTIEMYEPFDYSRFLQDGETYLRKQFGDEVADWQLANSNISEMKEYIPKFLQTVKQAVKSPDSDDIESLIDDGMLVTAVLNSRVLNGKNGYVGHSILIFDYDDLSYKFHDPGLPGVKSRVESKELILKAMGSASDVTGFRLDA